MEVSRDQSTILLKLTLEERLFLLRILTSLRGNYRIRPSDLDPKSARAWYATDGCPATGERERDSSDWVRQLHQCRTDNLIHIDRWLSQLSRAATRKGSLPITLTFQETPAFLQVINDHRMLMVHRHDLGVHELASDFSSVIKTLQPQRQLALCEVNLLAHMMEYILHALPGSGADWFDPDAPAYAGNSGSSK